MISEDYGGLVVHPAANIFPLIQGASFDQLVEDIRENGQVEAVVLDLDGLLIDGRNRVRACVRLGIRPVTRVHEGGDVVQFVVSHNLHRRHLTDSQRAMIAAELANLPHGTNRFSVETPIGVSRNGPPTRSEVKQLMQVSEGSLHRAKVINRDGIPQLRELAKTTNTPLTTLRRVAGTSPEEQLTFVKKIEAGEYHRDAAPPKGTAPERKAAEPLPVIVARVIHTTYNQGLRAQKLAPWN